MVRITILLVTITAWILCTISPSLAADDDSRSRLGPNPYLVEGAEALMFGNYNEGIRLTELGLETPPDWPDRSAALSNLCAGLAGSADYAEAIASCTSAIEIDDYNWQAYNNRAIANIGLGRIGAAQQDVDRGLELNPESSELTIVQQMVWTMARD
jgi:tetratricopeptide (TPR) repeat protein